MTTETVLIIDAGEDIDQRTSTTLEGESYLVYTVSSHDVNNDMAELLRPSLIYIRPSDLSPAGLKPCKAIHDIPILKKTPIIILASLKRAPGPHSLKDYGIVDFLELTFSPEELIEKTRTILGKAPPSQQSKEDEPAILLKNIKRIEKKRPILSRPTIGIIILLVILGAGFWVYQQVMRTPKVPSYSAVTIPLRVLSTAPEAGSKLQLPPAGEVANTSASTSSVPSAPPGQPSSPLSEATSQAPRKPFYSVQLGAFKNEDNAKALMNKFREKGYDAFIHLGVTNDRSPIYRVFVSKNEDRKAAQNLAVEIQSREEIKATLYSE